MKYHILPLLIICFFFTPCYSQEKNDFDVLNIKGEILKVKVTNYTPAAKIPQRKLGQEDSHSITEFNKAGFITTSEFFKQNKAIYKSDYSYDNQGNCTITTIFDNDSLKQQSTIKKRENGNYNQINVFNNSQKLISKSRFYYNNNLNIKVEHFNKEEKLIQIEENEFTDDLCTKITIRVNNKTLQERNIIYNQSGDPVSINVKSYIGSRAQEQNTTFEYVYDSMGNWIKKFHYVNYNNSKKLCFIEIREFIYSELNDNLNLIGNWVMRDNRCFNFKSDNTVSMQNKDGNIYCTGTWSIDIGLNKLYLKLKNTDGSVVTKNFHYKFDGFKWKLTDIDNKSITETLENKNHF